MSVYCLFTCWFCETLQIFLTVQVVEHNSQSNGDKKLEKNYICIASSDLEEQIMQKGFDMRPTNP